MVHNTLEEHLHTHCPNCGQEHGAQFLSHFTESLHYVVGSCSNCNYRIELPKHELGGGLFTPDGSVTTIKEVFRTQHVEHVKEQLRSQSPVSMPSLSHIQMRMVDSKDHNTKK